MSNALRTPAMTRDAFLDWVEGQEGRYEFDGSAPVAMGGGTVNHSRIAVRLLAALAGRLRGTGCEPLGPDAGVATLGRAVRYPDAQVTCTRTPGTARLVDGPVIVFEVLSPSSGRMDRIVKVREYAAVASIRRYVILEYDSSAALVLTRPDRDSAWTATTLTAEEMLALPEVGIEIPMAELYEGVDLAATE